MDDKRSVKFCDFHVIVGFFNLPQSCDRGQAALLPFLRIFSPEKSDGIGQHANHQTTEAAFHSFTHNSFSHHPLTISTKQHNVQPN
jgi:hypothetical protein